MPHARLNFPDFKALETSPDNQQPVNLVPPVNDQEFLQKVREDNFGACEAFLEVGVDVNCVDDEGSSPLMIAICNKNIRMVQLFLMNNANISYRNHEGLDALHFATTFCDIEACKLLIDHGAFDDKKDGFMNLFFAVRNSENRDESIIELIKIFAQHQLEIADNNYGLLCECASRDRIRVGEYLVQNFNFPDHFWQQENNPLTIAAREGKVDFCKMLFANSFNMLLGSPPELFLQFSRVLAQQENIEDKMRQYRTLRENDSYNSQDILNALFTAIQSKREDDANFFINYLYKNDRKKLDQVNDNGDSLLHALVDFKLPCLTTILLQLGVKIDAKNADGKTAFFCAVENESEEMVRAFAKSGVEVRNAGGEPALIEAVRRQNFSMVQKILMFDLDINFVDENKNSALHHAALSGNYEIYESLLDEKPNCNLQNCEGETAEEILSTKTTKPLASLMQASSLQLASSTKRVKF